MKEATLRKLADLEDEFPLVGGGGKMDLYGGPVVKQAGQIKKLQAEVERLKEEAADNPCADALEELWQKIILEHKPKYGEWEYPMQAMRHIVVEHNELRAEVEEARNAARELAEYRPVLAKDRDNWIDRFPWLEDE